jgi:hypothetical protein
MGTVMEQRDLSAKFESVCKSLALVAVPIIVAVAGHAVNGHFEQQKMAIERQKLDQEMFKQAMDVVFRAKDPERIFGSDASLEARRLYRAHWLKTYNTYAEVKISDELVAVVMERDAQARAAATGGESGVSKGWVAVGVFDTWRHADLNFDLVAPEASTRLANDMIIRARWSVPLRANTDLPSGSEVNSEVGRLAGGQCAKVVEFKSAVRGQAWALVETAECPGAQPLDRVAQVR